MKLNDYKKTLKNSIRPRTVTFLVNNKKVCLGLKRRGFGKGKYVGIGGKVESEKGDLRFGDKLTSAKQGACREIQEEIGSIVLPKNLVPLGI